MPIASWEDTGAGADDERCFGSDYDACHHSVSEVGYSLRHDVPRFYVRSHQDIGTSRYRAGYAVSVGYLGAYSDLYC